MNNKFWHPPVWFLSRCTLNTPLGFRPPPTRPTLYSPCSRTRHCMSDKHRRLDTKHQKPTLTLTAPAASRSARPSTCPSQDSQTSLTPSDPVCDLQHCQPDGPERKTLCRKRIRNAAVTVVWIKESCK